MWNHIKREHIYALLSNNGVLEKTYLIIKHDAKGLPYFVKDETHHAKQEYEELLNKRIPISDFDIIELKENEKRLFYENGRYTNNHAEVYLQIALKRNHICDDDNTVLIKDIIKLGKRGLSELYYSDYQRLNEKSILMAELCVREKYGVILE